MVELWIDRHTWWAKLWWWHAIFQLFHSERMLLLMILFLLDEKWWTIAVCNCRISPKRQTIFHFYLLALTTCSMRLITALIRRFPSISDVMVRIISDKPGRIDAGWIISLKLNSWFAQTQKSHKYVITNTNKNADITSTWHMLWKSSFLSLLWKLLEL